MNMDAIVNESREKYVLVFPDCVPVKGSRVSAIYDLTRRSISTFPSEYYPLFESFRTQRLGEILSEFSRRTGRTSSTSSNSCSATNTR